MLQVSRKRVPGQFSVADVEDSAWVFGQRPGATKLARDVELLADQTTLERGLRKNVLRDRDEHCVDCRDYLRASLVDGGSPDSLERAKWDRKLNRVHNAVS